MEAPPAFRLRRRQYVPFLAGALENAGLDIRCLFVARSTAYLRRGTAAPLLQLVRSMNEFEFNSLVMFFQWNNSLALSPLSSSAEPRPIALQIH